MYYVSEKFMNKLSEVSKRDIQDLFNLGISLPDGTTGRVLWKGRMDDADFLLRLYDLSSMPSFDRRYNDAEGDIRCHVGWGDWDDDWIFTDERFDLIHSEDDVFLEFFYVRFFILLLQGILSRIRIVQRCIF